MARCGDLAPHALRQDRRGGGVMRWVKQLICRWCFDRHASLIIDRLTVRVEALEERLRALGIDPDE
jgi:hypothetical protein